MAAAAERRVSRVKPPAQSQQAPVKHQDAERMWDPEMRPLVDLLISNQGVRIRQAVEVGRRAVDYFRGIDFVRWILKNEDLIRKKAPNSVEQLTSGFLKSPAGIAALGNRLIELGFIYRAQPKSLTVAPVAATSTSGTGDDAGTKSKYPKRLGLSENQQFDEDGFYVVIYEGSSTFRHALLGLLIFAVLVVCMFPAWPLAMKLATWYLSVSFMTLILFLITSRLITFVLLWFIGVDFWIFPNLFNEEIGVVESFFPLYTFEQRKDDWTMFFARIFAGILFAAAIFQLSRTHSISDVHLFARRQLLDVLDWGHQKLATSPADGTPAGNGTAGSVANNVSHSDGMPTIKSASGGEDEEDYTCMKGCGFETFEVFLDECFTECKCLKELVSMPCYKKCSIATRKAVMDAKLDACFEEESSERINKDESQGSSSSSISDRSASSSPVGQQEEL